MSNTCSRSSKVFDSGINRKRVCNFLLVINSNIGPILSRFRDIAGFLLSVENSDPTSNPEFLGVPRGVDLLSTLGPNHGDRGLPFPSGVQGRAPGEGLGAKPPEADI